MVANSSKCDRQFPWQASRAFGIIFGCVGGIAQLGERLHGMQEVIGSIPFTSTNEIHVRHYRPHRLEA